MAFVVEDGTGLDDANALVDVQFCDDYHADRGNDGWAGTAEQKQAAIIQASDYMLSMPWVSSPVSSTQGCAWPRAAYSTIPAQVKKACAEYSLRALTSALAPDPAVTPGIKKKRGKVGPLETDQEFSASTVSARQPYPAADRYIAGFLISGGVYK